MKRVVTFGEIMIRMATPRHERFVQAGAFEATYAGAEANVAVALANFGVPVGFVTCLPPNDLGDAAVNFVRQYGVDTGHIKRQGDRIGIYFVETGAVQRSSKVIYDRARSAIAEVRPGDIDWKEVLDGAGWFHVTGITPAISSGAAETTIEAVRTARDMGVTVSFDMNYRKKLWKWGKSPGEVMPAIAEMADVAVGNEEDAEKVFGIKAPGADVEGGKVEADSYRAVAEQLVERFPNLKRVAITLRGSISASHNTWSGVLYQGGDLYAGPTYDISPIVDRIGSGDSFAGGIIYATLAGKQPQKIIDFAVAAGCLKHTIHGDFALITVEEVERLVAGGGSGRVQR